nr:hypothetical protein [Tanacetum cinerariifolium]
DEHYLQIDEHYLQMFVDVTTGEDVEQDATVAKSVEKPSEFRTTSHPQLSQPLQAKDKGKGIMVEPKKHLKKKDQIALNEELARKLKAEMKAEMDEDERIARENNEAYITIIEEWDDVQAIIDADKQVGTGFSGVITPLFETMMVQASEEVGFFLWSKPRLIKQLKIKKLKKRVKKLEGKKKKKRTHVLKRLYKVGLSAKVESSKDEEGLGA